ncbi:MAG: aspartate kinase [Thermodesulfobacteriota bacterium]|nr:aspartate kinase [Thermodesulfobacteriota bacterium]
MARIVQKFGGTSVGDIERIKNVAKRVVETYNQGNSVAVVVSAMTGETDRLICLAGMITDKPDPRELDVVISTGEQVSIGLLALAIQSLGIPATSFVAHQVRISTDDAYGKARITNVDTEAVNEVMNNGSIAIIAGFQGIDQNGNITTLGRGGSDTTAVAIAMALQADIAEIYTDVGGVYTADPNICVNVKKLQKISYDEMLELASSGAKVLQSRSVEFAKKHNISLHVRSSFSHEEGTIVTQEDKDMEDVLVSGVTYDSNEVKITVIRVPDKPGIAAKLFTPISEANIIVDMIIQNASADGYTDLTFTIPKGDFVKTRDLVNRVAKELGAKEMITDENVAKVSIVGVGMRSHAGVASKMFSVLANEGINIQMISTSEIKISCVIDSKYGELAVRVLHNAFVEL